MQEYRDGSFGEVKEGSELLKALADDAKELARTKSIHFGTREELEDQKVTGTNAKQIKRKLDQLERKLNMILVHLGIDTGDEILIVDRQP